MRYLDKKVSREQIDKRLAPLKDFSVSGMPDQGWIKTIRQALGMSSAQLAKKAGLGQPRISRLESAEKNGNLKLSSLQKIAKVFGMKFVYGFVPEISLEDMVHKRAEKIVLGRMERLDSTMRLEQQGLSLEDKKKAIEGMIDQLLMEDAKEIWDTGNE